MLLTHRYQIFSVMFPGDVVQHFILFRKSGMFASQTFEPEKVGRKLCEKRTKFQMCQKLLYILISFFEVIKSLITVEFP